MNYLNVNIPFFFAYLDTGFFYDLEPSSERERVVVEVFAYTSIPKRCGMFSVMTEYGSQHARVPIHYLHNEETGGSSYPLDWLQLWDSMSYYCSVNILDYCKNRAANVMLKDKSLEKAQYMFTLDWCIGPQYTGGYGEMALATSAVMCLLETDNTSYSQTIAFCGWMAVRSLPRRFPRNQTGRYSAKSLVASTLVADGSAKAMRSYGFTTSKSSDRISNTCC